MLATGDLALLAVHVAGRLPSVCGEALILAGEVDGRGHRRRKQAAGFGAWWRPWPACKLTAMSDWLSAASAAGEPAASQAS